MSAVPLHVLDTITLHLSGFMYRPTLLASSSSTDVKCCISCGGVVTYKPELPTWSRFCVTCSQWSCLSTWVMWSRRRAPVTSRAAGFCTDYRLQPLDQTVGYIPRWLTCPQTVTHPLDRDLIVSPAS